MATESRAERVADLVQRVLAEAIQREIQDPRLKLASVAGVDVSRDLAHAKVYIAVLGDSQMGEKAMQALVKANGFLRRAVAKNCALRVTPQLHFFLDNTASQAQEINALINQALSKDNNGGCNG